MGCRIMATALLLIQHNKKPARVLREPGVWVKLFCPSLFGAAA